MESPCPTMVGSIQKKRSRPSGDGPPEDPGAVPPSLPSEDYNKKKKESKPDPPHYGSQDYWETRYRVQFQRLQKTPHDERSSTSEPTRTSLTGKAHYFPTNSDDGELVDTLPYHPWYFSYEDLRVILLPLILGGRKESFQIIGGSNDNESDDPSEQNSNAQHDPKGDNTLEPSAAVRDAINRSAAVDTSALGEVQTTEDGEAGDDASDGGSSENREDSDDAGGEDDSGLYEEVDPEAADDESDEEEEVSREGLAKNGPISVLEVGCGDVPLSCGMWNELLHLQRETEGNLHSIVKRIVATDYSSVVIDQMRAQHSGADPEFPAKESRDGRILTFETVDARKMPYAQESFELILEKGVLDAMLSDTAHGCDNCVQIVSECARVLAPGGVLVLCSHLNANTPKGIRWLEEVVFPGIGKLEPKVPWEIEVHGRECSETSDDNSSAGPAVYIVHKGRPVPGQQVAGTVPLKFFVY